MDFEGCLSTRRSVRKFDNKSLNNKITNNRKRKYKYYAKKDYKEKIYV